MARKATKPQAETVQTAEVAEMEPKAEDIQTEEKAAVSATEEPKKTPGRKRASKKEADQTETVKPVRKTRKTKKEAEAEEVSVSGNEAKQEEAPEETVKSAAKKSGQQCSLYVQYGGRSLSQEDLMNIAKDVWKYDLKQKAGSLKNVDLYVKPEENKVYYVMNGEFTGNFDI